MIANEDMNGFPPVHLFAFGKRGYIHAAANMAASIKQHSPLVRIVLHCDGSFSELTTFHQGLFDQVRTLPEGSYTTNGITDPGKLKCHMAEHIGRGLYLDVDGICLRPLEGLLHSLSGSGKPYFTDVVSKGPAGTSLKYFEWALPQTVVQKHDLKAGTNLYALQTSWAWIDTAFAGKFFDRVVEVHDSGMWKQSDLRVKWGASLPDELIYGSVCSEFGYDPSYSSKVVFHGDSSGSEELSDLSRSHYVMSLYGNGNGRTSVRLRYIEMYDRYLQTLYRQWGTLHIYKSSSVMRDKYVNGTKKLQAALAAHAAHVPSPAHAPAR